MEKFEIAPNEEKRRHEEALKKVDPRIAEILRGHLTYPTPPKEEGQRKVEGTPEGPPKNTPQFKTFIERSLQDEKD